MEFDFVKQIYTAKCQDRWGIVKIINLNTVDNPSVLTRRFHHLVTFNNNFYIFKYGKNGKNTIIV